MRYFTIYKYRILKFSKKANEGLSRKKKLEFGVNYST
jgi:hypothetical protein